MLHLDATCDGADPFLMSGLDSITEFALGNVKLPSENADAIIPFLEEIKQLFGDPVAAVHDMGAGIIKAVTKVFPNTPDFICHYHVPPVVVVDAVCTAELGAQHTQRLVQLAFGMEVCEQRAHRLVRDRGLPWGPLEVVGVGVSSPARLPRRVSMPRA